VDPEAEIARHLHRAAPVGGISADADYVIDYLSSRQQQQQQQLSD